MKTDKRNFYHTKMNAIAEGYKKQGQQNEEKPEDKKETQEHLTATLLLSFGEQLLKLPHVFHHLAHHPKTLHQIIHIRH